MACPAISTCLCPLREFRPFVGHPYRTNETRMTTILCPYLTHYHPHSAIYIPCCGNNRVDGSLGSLPPSDGTQIVGSCYAGVYWSVALREHLPVIVSGPKHPFHAAVASRFRDTAIPLLPSTIVRLTRINVP